MNLFQYTGCPFISHAGNELQYKIECDALTDEDWECVAYIIAKEKNIRFGSIIGVAQGGLKLAKACARYLDPMLSALDVLIVDDVLTTGSSMEKSKEQANSIKGIRSIQGAVLFARGECAEWITPICQM